PRRRGAGVLHGTGTRLLLHATEAARAHRRARARSSRTVDVADAVLVALPDAQGFVLALAADDGLTLPYRPGPLRDRLDRLLEVEDLDEDRVDVVGRQDRRVLVEVTDLESGRVYRQALAAHEVVHDPVQAARRPAEPEVAEGRVAHRQHPEHRRRVV